MQDMQTAGAVGPWLSGGVHQSLNFHGDLEFPITRSPLGSDLQFLSHPSLPNASLKSHRMTGTSAEGDALSSPNRRELNQLKNAMRENKDGGDANVYASYDSQHLPNRAINQAATMTNSVTALSPTTLIDLPGRTYHVRRPQLVSDRLDSATAIAKTLCAAPYSANNRSMAFTREETGGQGSSPGIRSGRPAGQFFHKRYKQSRADTFHSMDQSVMKSSLPSYRGEITKKPGRRLQTAAKGEKTNSPDSNEGRSISHVSTGAFALRGTLADGKEIRYRETSPKSSMEPHYAASKRESGMRASLPVKAVSSLERSYDKGARGSAHKPELDPFAINMSGYTGELLQQMGSRTTQNKIVSVEPADENRLHLRDKFSRQDKAVLVRRGRSKNKETRKRKKTAPKIIIKPTSKKQGEKKVTLLESSQSILNDSEDVADADKKQAQDRGGGRARPAGAGNATQQPSTNGGVISGPSNNNFQNNINNSIILLAQPSSPGQGASGGGKAGGGPSGSDEPPRASINQLLMLEQLNNMNFDNYGATIAQLREQFGGLNSQQPAAAGASNAEAAENRSSAADKDSLERQNNEMLMKILYNNYQLSKKHSKSSAAAKNAPLSQRRGKQLSRASRGGSRGATSHAGRRHDTAKGERKEDRERLDGILDLSINNNGLYGKDSAKPTRSESPQLTRSGSYRYAVNSASIQPKNAAITLHGEKAAEAKKPQLRKPAESTVKHSTRLNEDHSKSERAVTITKPSHGASGLKKFLDPAPGTLPAKRAALAAGRSVSLNEDGLSQLGSQRSSVPRPKFGKGTTSKAALNANNSKTQHQKASEKFMAAGSDRSQQVKSLRTREQAEPDEKSSTRQAPDSAEFGKSLGQDAVATGPLKRQITVGSQQTPQIGHVNQQEEQAALSRDQAMKVKIASQKFHEMLQSNQLFNDVQTGEIYSAMLGLLQAKHGGSAADNPRVPPRKSLTSWGAGQNVVGDRSPAGHTQGDRAAGRSVSARSSDDSSYLQTGTYDKEVPPAARNGKMSRKNTRTNSLAGRSRLTIGANDPLVEESNHESPDIVALGSQTLASPTCQVNEEASESSHRSKAALADQENVNNDKRQILFDAEENRKDAVGVSAERQQIKSSIPAMKEDASQFNEFELLFMHNVVMCEEEPKSVLDVTVVAPAQPHLHNDQKLINLDSDLIQTDYRRLHLASRGRQTQLLEQRRPKINYSAGRASSANSIKVNLNSTLENFTRLNQTITAARHRMTADTVLGMYRLSLFDNNRSYSRGLRIIENAIHEEMAAKEATIAGTRARILTNLDSDIKHEQQQLLALDARIWDFKICPNLIKVAFGARVEDNGPDQPPTIVSVVESKQAPAPRGAIPDRQRAVLRQQDERETESVGSSDRLADAAKLLGAPTSVNSKAKDSMSPKASNKGIEGLSVRKKKKLLELIAAKMSGFRLQATLFIINLNEKHLRRRFQFAQNEHLAAYLAGKRKAEALRDSSWFATASRVKKIARRDTETANNELESNNVGSVLRRRPDQASGSRGGVNANQTTGAQKKRPILTKTRTIEAFIVPPVLTTPSEENFDQATFGPQVKKQQPWQELNAKLQLSNQGPRSRANLLESSADHGEASSKNHIRISQIHTVEGESRGRQMSVAAIQPQFVPPNGTPSQGPRFSVPSNNFTLARGNQSNKEPQSIDNHEDGMGAGDAESLSSRESSVESAIYNAQNLGIDGDGALQRRVDALDEQDGNTQAGRRNDFDRGGAGDQAAPARAQVGLHVLTQQEFEEREDDQITHFKMNHYLESKRKVESALMNSLGSFFKRKPTDQPSQFKRIISPVRKHSRVVEESSNDESSSCGKSSSVSCSASRSGGFSGAAKRRGKSRASPERPRTPQSDKSKARSKQASGAVSTPTSHTFMARKAMSTVGRNFGSSQLQVPVARSTMSSLETITHAIGAANTLKAYRARATPAAQRKVEDEKVLGALYDDELMPDALRRLRKVKQVVRRNMVFFLNENLQADAGGALTVAQLTQKIAFDKTLLEQYIRANWTATTLRAKQKKSAIEAEVARYERFVAAFSYEFRKLQSESIYQNMFLVLQKNSLGAIGLRATMSALISSPFAPKLIYEQWLIKRAARTIEQQYIQPENLFAMNHGIWWSCQSHMVKVFLETSKKRAAAAEKALEESATPDGMMSDAEVGAGLAGKNLLGRIDSFSDATSDSLTIEEKNFPEPRRLALFKDSMMNENKDNTADFDVRSENSGGSFMLSCEKGGGGPVDEREVFLMHKLGTFKSLCQAAIVQGSCQYELFRTLTQSKVHKIKHLIFEKFAKQFGRESLVDDNIRLLRHFALKNSDYPEQTKIDLEVCSDDPSSDAQSQSSIQQTSKYMFVENYEKQKEKSRRLNEMERRRQCFQLGKWNRDLRWEAPGPFCSKSHKAEAPLEKPFKKIDRQYGFRYGNKNILRLLRKEFGINGEPGQVEMDVKQEKQGGVVRLTNGLSLRLSDESEVDYCVLETAKNVAEEKQGREYLDTIQAYYDETKQKLKDTIYNDNLLISYKRSQVQGETAINEVMAQSFFEVQRQRLQKYLTIRAQSSAFKCNLTNKTSQYVNPFEPKEHYESEDKSRAKYEPEGGLGLKCKDFQLRCVLQSIGDLTQKDELEFEREQAGAGVNVRKLPSCYDESTGYPIYMMFEVIHVYRRLNRRQEEAKERRAKLPESKRVASNKVYQLLALQLSTQVGDKIGQQLKQSQIPQGTAADLRRARYEVKRARTESLLQVLGVDPSQAKPLFDNMHQEHLMAEAEARAAEEAARAAERAGGDRTPTPSASEKSPPVGHHADPAPLLSIFVPRSSGSKQTPTFNFGAAMASGNGMQEITEEHDSKDSSEQGRRRSRASSSNPRFRQTESGSDELRKSTKPHFGGPTKVDTTKPVKEVPIELEDSPDKAARDEKSIDSFSSSFDSSKDVHVDVEQIDRSQPSPNIDSAKRRQTVNLLKDPLFMSINGEKVLKHIPKSGVRSLNTIIKIEPLEAPDKDDKGSGAKRNAALMPPTKRGSGKQGVNNGTQAAGGGGTFGSSFGTFGNYRFGAPVPAATTVEEQKNELKKQKSARMEASQSPIANLAKRIGEMLTPRVKDERSASFAVAVEDRRALIPGFRHAIANVTDNASAASKSGKAVVASPSCKVSIEVVREARKSTSKSKSSKLNSSSRQQASQKKAVVVQCKHWQGKNDEASSTSSLSQDFESEKEDVVKQSDDPKAADRSSCLSSLSRSLCTEISHSSVKQSVNTSEEIIPSSDDSLRNDQQLQEVEAEALLDQFEKKNVINEPIDAMSRGSNDTVKTNKWEREAQRKKAEADKQNFMMLHKGGSNSWSNLSTIVTLKKATKVFKKGLLQSEDKQKEKDDEKAGEPKNTYSVKLIKKPRTILKPPKMAQAPAIEESLQERNQVKINSCNDCLKDMVGQAATQLSGMRQQEPEHKKTKKISNMDIFGTKTPGKAQSSMNVATILRKPTAITSGLPGKKLGGTPVKRSPTMFKPSTRQLGGLGIIPAEADSSPQAVTAAGTQALKEFMRKNHEESQAKARQKRMSIMANSKVKGGLGGISSTSLSPFKDGSISASPFKDEQAAWQQEPVTPTTAFQLDRGFASNMKPVSATPGVPNNRRQTTKNLNFGNIIADGVKMSRMATVKQPRERLNSDQHEIQLNAGAQHDAKPAKRILGRHGLNKRTGGTDAPDFGSQMMQNQTTGKSTVRFDDDNEPPHSNIMRSKTVRQSSTSIEQTQQDRRYSIDDEPIMIMGAKNASMPINSVTDKNGQISGDMYQQEATTPATALAPPRSLMIVAQRSVNFEDLGEDVTPGAGSTISRQLKRSVTQSNVTIQKEKALDIRKREMQLRVQADEFFEAIKFNKPSRIKSIMTKMNSLEYEDAFGNTPLNVAVQAGQFETMMMLLERHAIINTQNCLGNTPLHYACAYNYSKIQFYLIEKGADEEILNNQGKTPWEGI